ncbi:MAG: class I SAM-dependent methyltransferase [Cytophagaceae bacterium]|nr:class I SAM-dependent methyltransferase [Cytophagaceae bacterium]
MEVNTNTWNKIRYTVYLPVYDVIGNIFNRQRQRSIELAGIKPTDKILIVGAGTGLDLQWLKPNKHIVAIDITPGMVNKMRKRAMKLNMAINAKVGDGQKLDLPDDSFDVVFLHLILAVIPDPNKCILEVQRVLKKGGVVMVFDKFLADDKKVGVLRKVFNPVTNLIATNINRRLGDILFNTGFQKEIDEEAGFGGIFRIIRLRK